jgi:HAD superfamily, subfamily IIIB (Acid phosphatase)
MRFRGPRPARLDSLDQSKPRHDRSAATRRARATAALTLAIALLLLGGVALATSAGGPTVKYRAPGGNEIGLRPTGVGLPNVGESGTVGAGELVRALIAYHESGEYEADLANVDEAATSYLNAHLSSGHAKSALVLDIDETSLSNYAGLVTSGFTAAGTVATAATGTDTAIAPTLALYHDAIAHGVAVFFVTGRPELIKAVTESNLENVGYDEGWSGLYFKPTEADTEQFKSSTRESIKKSGYKIVANVGDQQSDLDGGFAQQDFKLPDPFYYIPD